MVVFWGHDGFESGDRGCGWCSGVGCSGGACVVEVICSMRMGVGIGSVGNRGGSVVSSGGNISVTVLLLSIVRVRESDNDRMSYVICDVLLLGLFCFNRALFFITNSRLGLLLRRFFFTYCVKAL